MKRIEVTVETTKIMYEAYDGNQFPSKEECAKYEESAKCALLSKYNKYVIRKTNEENLFDAGSEEYDYDIVTIPHDDAEETILQLLYFFNPYLTDERHEENNERYVNRISRAKKEKDFLFINRGYCDDGGNSFLPTCTFNERKEDMLELCKPEESAKTEEK